MILSEKNIKELTGTVVSIYNNTVVVRVSLVKKHPLYNKRFTVHKKYVAHTEDLALSPAQRVKIIQCKPMSKTKKRFIVS